MLDRANKVAMQTFMMQAISAARQDALFSPLSLGEKYSVKLKPDFDTACWSYQPPHCIFVGTAILDRTPHSVMESDLSRYVQSYVHHELAHAHWTERDLQQVQRDLAGIKAPFQLFNLFEDARIEQLYRVNVKREFQWLTVEKLTLATTPLNWLFNLIQAEGQDNRVIEFIKSANITAEWTKAIQECSKLVKENSGNPKKLEQHTQALRRLSELLLTDDETHRKNFLAMFARVCEYYVRICAATSSQGLYPILEEWLAEFGNQDIPQDMSDLQFGLRLMDEQEFKNFNGNSIEVPLSEDAIQQLQNKRQPTPNRSSLEAKKGSVLKNAGIVPDIQRVEKLAFKLQKFFEAETRITSTQTPQRKISVRHFITDRPYYRIKQIMGKARKKVVIQFDCSGSMRGFHTEEGKVLLAALSRLAEKHYIEGHVVFSKSYDDHACWERHTLPLTDVTISRVHGYAGGEGLEGTMSDNLSLLKSADYAFVYTDGQLSDAPIDKVKFHRQGVYTVGLYAGNNADYLTAMQSYFDKAILRKNAEALVDAICTLK